MSEWVGGCGWVRMGANGCEWVRIEWSDRVSGVSGVMWSLKKG